ncbi:zinc-binding dehydrogenase [Isoptericola sp. b441]|uniref:Zinc-binding dehydrogenase n=1 Tax=Actinotalea lenta TaxID=3064654 RepID=A0ABT9D6V9_9CELL|nr:MULTISPECIES: zinc-binding dehydrogenase [unclassified Isoptericola]MDO8106574.1 zinc-binding dehydrogenase [Isoptericola sp. b441]MDO8121718.1 zinc-binding dehydrogenase [Isoptericola sp. b490]
MLAALAARICPDDPVSGLDVTEVPDAAAPGNRPDWSVVQVRAAALNHHDLWSLRGVGLSADQLPMVLGTDASGVVVNGPDDGSPGAGSDVVVYPVIGATGHGVGATERRSLLSERYPGTLAEHVAVPSWNLVPKPAELSFAEAACLPTAWLTAYRMLFTTAGLRPGDRVLVQGAGGGVSSAAIALGAAAGLEVVATSRTAAKRDHALAAGAVAALEPGARSPVRVDAVIETVGAATWSHSIRSLRPGGTVVVAGATSGDQPGAELTRMFFTELRVLGATMGSRDDLEALLRFLVRSGLRPTVDSTHRLADARAAVARLASGEHLGKIVVRP